MKPRPLNLDDLREEISDLTISIAVAREEGDEEEHEKVVNNILELFRRCIKSACEFYQRYENDPKGLVKEHYHLLKEMEDDDIWAFTLLFAAPDLKIKDIDKYNEWLFKLAFEVKEK